MKQSDHYQVQLSQHHRFYHHHDDDYPTDDRPDAVDGSEDAPTDAEAGDGEVDGSSDDADERTLEPAMASTEETTVG